MNLNTDLDKMLHRYIARHIALTNRPPGAIPVTSAEHDELRRKYEAFAFYHAPSGNPDDLIQPEPITDYCGCELFFSDDAARLRDI